MLLGRQRCCSPAYPKALVQLASKLTESAKYCYLDFVMGFVTQAYAYFPRFSGVFGDVSKRTLFGTKSGG
jgi:hypothetical protein